MLNELAQKINETAHVHGWWDTDRSFGDIIALCHSELSEALEAYRNHEEMLWFNCDKPEGMAVEMIDCVIRIFDYLSQKGIDIDKVMQIKIDYNETRPYRHGDKEM